MTTFFFTTVCAYAGVVVPVSTGAVNSRAAAAAIARASFFIVQSSWDKGARERRLTASTRGATGGSEKMDRKYLIFLMNVCLAR